MRSVAAVLCAVAAVLLLLAATPAVDARSNGILASCDLTGSAKWPMGVYGANYSQNAFVMTWVQPPAPTSYYSLRTADTPIEQRSSDSTSYVPGQLNEIHLRVHHSKKRFIGLVMYATNGTKPSKNQYNSPILVDRQVGDWTFLPTARFQKPASCGGQTVTHIDAEPKPFHSRFWFTAPAGTGTVQIRILLKQGEQGKGFFWYPDQLLTLTEAAAPARVPKFNTTAPSEPLAGPTATQLVVGGRGQSCADACNTNTPATPYCHGDATAALASQAALKAAATNSNLTCAPSVRSGCPYAGGAKVDIEGVCTFRQTTLASCPKAFVDAPATPKPDVCFTAAYKDNAPICVCTNTRALQPKNYYTSGGNPPDPVVPDPAGGGTGGNGGSGGDALSSASSAAVSKVLLAGLAAFAVMFSSRSSLSVSGSACVLLLLVSVAAPAFGHNYIMSLHRSREAAVVVPCQKRIGYQPHVQVVADQEFGVDWSLGHGVGDTYFALVREEDLDYVGAPNISAIILDYLDNAPTDSHNIPSHFQKHHIRGVGAMNTSDDPTIPTYPFWVEWNMSDTHPDYFHRDPVFADLSHPGSFGSKSKLVQNRFAPEYLSLDKRNSYDSAKYPWIISGAMINSPLQPHGTFVAGHLMAMRWVVPPRVGPGNYVVFFMWYGYRDGVDINVLPGTTPVAAPYGQPPSTTVAPDIIKMDHCEYLYVSHASVPCQKAPKVAGGFNATACIDACIKLGTDKCTSVAVVRATNLPTTLKMTPNIPYIEYYGVNYTAGGLHEPDPCSKLNIDDRMTGAQAIDRGVPCSAFHPQPSATCDKTKLNLADDDYVCYGLVPDRVLENQVEEEYIFTKEPTDPMFYSTCFHVDPWRSFIDIKKAGYEAPDWRQGDQCVKCDVQPQIQALDVKVAPNWEAAMTDQCMDCDLALSQKSIAELKPTIIGANLVTAGHQDL